jgi:phage terminase large subunit
LPALIEAKFPEALEFLFDVAPYKVAHGGRGSGKSWGFARALLILAAQKPLRMLCARETQRSIAESVHRLLSDQIALLGLSSFYEIQEAGIYGRNGSDFTFAGIRQQNITSIKSYEGVDICWVEEAQIVTKRSWEVLIPTIRKPGAEIWVSFNPDLETDDTYQRFVVNPPAGAVVRSINFSDNPWFSDGLREKMLHLKATDENAYRNIWLGECRTLVEGAIYHDELLKAREEGRICGVPFDGAALVETWWDLGILDPTAIWFIQRVGREIHLIDYYENSGQPITHYFGVLAQRDYPYSVHRLPHDAEAREKGTGKSLADLFRANKLPIGIGKRLGPEERINAAKSMFSRCWFDQVKCKEGIRMLSNYRQQINKTLDEFTASAVHDFASHGADAFGEGAIAEERAKSSKPFEFASEF